MPVVMLTLGLCNDATDVSVIDIAVRPVRGDVGAPFSAVLSVAPAAGIVRPKPDVVAFVRGMCR